MLTRDDITDIIENRQWERFIGEEEGPYLECKRDLLVRLTADDRQKLKLAKAVSSLANSDSGGYLIFGLETRTSAEHFGDEITGLNPFVQHLADRDQYQKVVQDWIYPTVDDLRMNWFPHEGDPARGFFVIEVPRQSEAKRPFVISKSFVGEGRLDILLGYVERRQAASVPMRIQELHQLIRDGRSIGVGQIRQN